MTVTRFMILNMLDIHVIVSSGLSCSVKSPQPGREDRRCDAESHSQTDIYSLMAQSQSLGD